MARLIFIVYVPLNNKKNEHGEIVWTAANSKPIKGLPQIFWENGEGWCEANIWALECATSWTLDIETVKSRMKHLQRYANFLEVEKVDWRNFPVRKEEQSIRRFRGRLIQARTEGVLAPATVTACMTSVVQFYRFAATNKLLESTNYIWGDRAITPHKHDISGFTRNQMRMNSDFRIPNRRTAGSQLEDGLVPLRTEHMSDLLRFTHEHETLELHMMLSIGFFTGARIGTITTLTTRALATATEDPLLPGLFFLPVGPGTGVATKFGVSGRLMIPEALLIDLQRFASSTPRLLRVATAGSQDKNSLFLTRRGQPYSVETVASLVCGLRSRAASYGLGFMTNFRFHQTRATFGTWLMTLLLETGSKAEAVRIVKDAMLHKDERTTLSYVQFLEDTASKEYLSAEFSKAFTGLKSRNWNDLDA